MISGIAILLSFANRSPGPSGRSILPLTLFSAKLTMFSVPHSGVMMGAGDLMCQTMVAKGIPKESYDLPRTARMASWGLIVYGAVGHGWYLAVDKMIRIPGAKGTVLKVAADQLIFSAPLTAGFFTWQHFFWRPVAWRVV